MPRVRSAAPAALNEFAMRTNFGVLEYCRTCQAAISGCAAGILGLPTLQGFLFYFICALIQSAMWFGLKAQCDWNRYFLNRSPLFHGLFGGLFTYLLFWTFLYGMVHVY